LILLLYFFFGLLFVSEFLSQNVPQSRGRNCTLTDWWLHLLALRTKINGTALCDLKIRAGAPELLHTSPALS
jgi:hypothetical protein